MTRGAVRRCVAAPALMYPVAADLEGRHQSGFVGQPFRPAFADGLFVDVAFGQLDEQMIMTGFTFHEAAVELAEIGVFEPFVEPFEALATAGFDEGEDQQPVEKAGLFAAVLALELHQFIDVFIFALRAQLQASFVQLGEDEPEMAPFFRDDGAYFFYETFFRRVALDQGDAAGGGFLFAPGVVREDIFEGDRGDVHPAWVRRELEA